LAEAKSLLAFYYQSDCEQHSVSFFGSNSFVSRDATANQLSAIISVAVTYPSGKLENELVKIGN